MSRDRSPSPLPLRRRIRNLAGAALLALPLGLLIFTGLLHHEGRRVALPLGFQLGPEQPLYPTDDPWRHYLAPEEDCPGGEARRQPEFSQTWTMICLLNWARERRGLPRLVARSELMAAALFKARDLERCGEFRHDACGRRPDAVVHQAAYAAADWGENLYFGTRELSSARVALDRWLNSPEHRANVFGRWTDVGVALLRASDAAPEEDSGLWVAHFGRR